MFVNKINNKQYYRFIEFTLKLLNKDLSHTRTKLIVLDEYRCESEQEKEIKRFANAFLYILNNSKQIINKSLLKNIYYLMEEKEIDEEEINKIIETIYIDFDKNAYYLAAKTHIEILSSNLKEKEKYAFLLLNLILLKKTKNIVILRENTFTHYKQIIKEKEINKLILFIIQNECTKQNKTSKEIPSIESIKSIINKYKTELVNKYLVEKLYLYGSITNGTLTQDSDIDFVIKYQDECSDIEKQNRLIGIKKILTKELKFPRLDFIKFNNALKKMNLDVFENIITLI